MGDLFPLNTSRGDPEIVSVLLTPLNPFPNGSGEVLAHPYPQFGRVRRMGLYPGAAHVEQSHFFFPVEVRHGCATNIPGDIVNIRAE